MTPAEQIMLQANPNSLIGVDDDGAVVMIEDVTDPDGRLYRLEYRSTVDGRHAVGFCRFNPWGGVNGGEAYAMGHVAENGFLCFGADHGGQDVATSPYNISFVIRRARFWCTAFSVLKETGQFPSPQGDRDGLPS